jgi:hypothetical protein
MSLLLKKIELQVGLPSAPITLLFAPHPVITSYPEHGPFFESLNMVSLPLREVKQLMS